MPSVGTQFLNAIAAKLVTLFPDIPCKIRRDSEKNPLYTPAEDDPPVFVVTANENVPVEGLTATEVMCTYDVTVHYLTKELPGDRDENDDPRLTQETVRKAFDVAAWSPVSQVSQIDPIVMKSYTLPFGDQTINDSPVLLKIQAIESRN